MFNPECGKERKHPSEVASEQMPLTQSRLRNASKPPGPIVHGSSAQDIDREISSTAMRATATTSHTNLSRPRLRLRFGWWQPGVRATTPDASHDRQASNPVHKARGQDFLPQPGNLRTRSWPKHFTKASARASAPRSPRQTSD